jgi:TPR repeat protein
VVAQYILGILYNEGVGVPEDKAQAANWFRKAHAQGYSLNEDEINIMNNY